MSTPPLEPARKLGTKQFLSAAVRTLSKHSGNIISVTGMGHCLPGFIQYKDSATQIADAGIIGAAELTAETSRFFWFEMSGVFLIFTGLFIQHYIPAVKRPIPARFAWYLLGIGLLGCLLMPVSGFYVFIVIPIAMLVVKNAVF